MESHWSYVTGGTLSPDAPSYVERQADKDLLASLQAGETCYVLNSRQMGKSSLCVRTILRLKDSGVRTVFLDLTKFGGRNLTADQWYAALLSEAGRDLGLRPEFLAYWKENAALPPVQRLFGALTELGLKGGSPVVVFVDEIDVTLSLPFSADEFFAAVRQCYVGRATDEKLKRLSFCLLGTATPADLIQDTRVSPFNIGKRIELQDFTEAEASPLAAGLGEAALLGRVLYWTGGHPYLTQRLCQAVRDSGSKDVDKVCSELFLTHAAKEGDDNLAFVRNRLLKSEADLAALLTLFAQVRSGRAVPDDETNPLCALLKLSGVARVERGNLKVRNRIYGHVFDKAWVETHMPDAEKRRQRAAAVKAAWRVGLVAAVVVLALSAISVQAFQLAGRLQAALTRAADLNRQKDTALQQARDQARVASQALGKASDAAKAETEQRQIASLQAKNAQIQADNARAASLAAQAAKAKAENNEGEAKRLLRESQLYTYIAIMQSITAAAKARNYPLIPTLLEQAKDLPDRGFEWGYWDRLMHRELASWDARSISRSFNDGFSWSQWVAPNGSAFALARSHELTEIRDPVSGDLICRIEGQSPHFSPDSKLILTSKFRDNFQRTNLVAWSATNGKKLFELVPDGDQNVVTYAFSRNGRWIVTSADSHLSVYDAKNGARVAERDFLESSGAIKLAINDAGTHVAIGIRGSVEQDQPRVFIWKIDLQTPLQPVVADSHKQYTDLKTFDFSADGRWIYLDDFSHARAFNVDTLIESTITDGYRKCLLDPSGTFFLRLEEFPKWSIWDIRQQKKVFDVILGSYDPLITGDSKRHEIALYGGDGDPQGVITVLDTGKWATKRQLKLQASAVTSLFMSPSGDILATSKDSSLQLWDSDGNLINEFLGSSSESKFACLIADGQRVLSFHSTLPVDAWSPTGTVELWDSSDKASLVTDTFHSSLTMDGQYLVIAGNSLGVIAASNGLKSYEVGSGNQSTSRMACTPNASLVAFADDRVHRFHNGSVGLQGEATGKVLVASRDGTIRQSIQLSKRNIKAIAFSPNTKYLAALNDEDTLSVIDLKSWQVTNACYKTSGVNPVEEATLVWISNIELAAYGRTPYRWNSATNQVHPIDLPEGGIAYLSGDTKRVLWFHETDWQLRDTRSDDLVSQISCLKGVDGEGRLNQDGSLAVVFSGVEAKVVDIQANRVVSLLQGHSDEILGASFSPDSSRVATVGKDQIVRLWNVATGRELLQCPARTSGSNLANIQFNPEGTRLLVNGVLLYSTRDEGPARMSVKEWKLSRAEKAFSKHEWSRSYDDLRVLRETTHLSLEHLSQLAGLAAFLDHPDVARSVAAELQLQDFSTLNSDDAFKVAVGCRVLSGLLTKGSQLLDRVNKAVKEEPEKYGSAVSPAALLLRLGRPIEALERLSPLVKDDGARARPLHLRYAVLALLNLGKVSEARRLYALRHSEDQIATQFVPECGALDREIASAFNTSSSSPVETKGQP